MAGATPFRLLVGAGTIVVAFTDIVGAVLGSAGFGAMMSVWMDGGSAWTADDIGALLPVLLAVWADAVEDLELDELGLGARNELHDCGLTMI